MTIALEDITSMTGAGIMNGLILGMSALAYLPVDLKDCIQAKDDMIIFAEWAKLFAHPKQAESTILHNIKGHLAVLTLDVTKLKKDLSHDNYIAAGVVLGEMLAIVTEPIAQAQDLQ